MIGEKFGRLTAISTAAINGVVHVKCRCDCGEIHVAMKGNLTKGTTRSCGCLKREYLSDSKSTHRMSKTATYTSWAMMTNRCTNDGATDYRYYGGRGISICRRWKKFENFLADMGERPAGMTIDRINCNGNYEKTNCRWANRITQHRNRRNNRMITFDGQTKCLAEWAEAVGLDSLVIFKRLRRGWPIEKALREPLKARIC